MTPEFYIDDKTLEIGAVGTIVLPTLAHDNSNADCTFSIDYSMLDDDLTEIDAAVQVIYSEIPTPRFSFQVDDPSFADQDHDLVFQAEFKVTGSDGTERVVYTYTDEFVATVENGCDATYTITI